MVKDRMLTAKQQLLLDKRRAYMKLYRKTHRDELLAKARAYRKFNKDAVRATAKRYRDRHPERVSGTAKRYRDTHKMELHAKAKVYRTKTQQQRREYNSSYYKMNRAAIQAKVKRYREDHKDELATKQKRYRVKNGPILRARACELRKARKITVPKELPVCTRKPCMAPTAEEKREYHAELLRKNTYDRDSSRLDAIRRGWSDALGLPQKDE